MHEPTSKLAQIEGSLLIGTVSNSPISYYIQGTLVSSKKGDCLQNDEKWKSCQLAEKWKKSLLYRRKNILYRRKKLQKYDNVQEKQKLRKVTSRSNRPMVSMGNFIGTPSRATLVKSSKVQKKSSKVILYRKSQEKSCPIQEGKIPPLKNEKFGDNVQEKKSST